MTKKIRAGIIGAAGYTGGELLRVLLNHPDVVVEFVQSSSNPGVEVARIHQDLTGDTDLIFSARHHTDIDVLFLCAGHGEASKFFATNELPISIRVIDIGNDFRLSGDSIQGDRRFVYGLPELNREKIASADSIANPGCFATAIILGLLPLAHAGVLSQVFTTGITGSTGAGQALSATGHFSWRANNIQPYKTFSHQHLAEINESLQQFQPSFSNSVKTSGDLNFVPWRGDFPRGILVSSQFNTDLEPGYLTELYHKFYHAHAFVTLSKEPISLKQVVNTNKAVIQIEQSEEKVVIHSVIDNLLKGASGQAVQNMNLMFGLDERAGLRLKAVAF